jgi:phosphoribosylaminoimidazole carboxylase PurE protein
MGSDSDMAIMREACTTLDAFAVGYEVIIASAHRTPARAARWAESAAERGLKVIIAGAGWAAHLAGVIAAGTLLPVVAVPIDSSPLNGLDALLSMVQMPAGIPVATMAIGKGGARNAALFAVQILATADSALVKKLADYRLSMEQQVIAKDAEIQKSLKK